MKRILLLGFLFILVITSKTISQGVKIGAAGNPNSNAVLELDGGTNKGLLLPRLSNVQMTAMNTAPDGMIVYNTTDLFLYIRKNAGWIKLVDNSSTGFSIPFTDAQSSASGLFNLTNSGTGGVISASASGGTALQATSTGWGTAIQAATDKGFGVSSIINDTGVALYGLSQKGNAGKFEIQNYQSQADAVKIKNVGYGSGISIESSFYGKGIDIVHNGAIRPAINIDLKQNTSGITIYDTTQFGFSSAHGILSYVYGGTGVAGYTKDVAGCGIYGLNEHGEAVVGITTALNNQVAAVVGRNNGPGAGVRGFSTSTGGFGILGEGGNSSSNTIAGKFINTYAPNTAEVLQVITQATSTNNLAVFKKGNNNVARIDQNGKGYFNGGTQSSGADVAEVFAVKGSSHEYEPGDVLVISPDADRLVEKSNKAYSTTVVGVYATKPGVLLTEESIDNDLTDKVPMGVIGVIPTKVCDEGGAIQRGDLLVTSSLPGYAMKADPGKIKPGQVIGKALQNFDKGEKGKISVLVSVK